MTEHTPALEIPPHLIAQTPLHRGSSRLLVRSRHGQLTHTHFHRIATMLPRGTLLLLNNSSVFPARLKLDNGSELLLLSAPRQCATASFTCEALGRPMRQLAVGNKLQLDRKTQVQIMTKRTHSGHTILTLHFTHDGNLEAWLAQHAHVPLPPYIKRANERPAPYSADLHSYQTVYASISGSVAAPTAGLHFSRDCLDKLAAAGIETAYLTLHVSAGTFLPVRTAHIADHTLLPERYFLPRPTLQAIHTAYNQQRPIIAVGTTVLRALEAFCRAGDQASPDNWLSTNLFIYPQQHRFKPQLLSGLLTNFHQPSSTLFLLINALLGADAAIDMYRTAVQHRYRFFSYGDSCLLWL